MANILVVGSVNMDLVARVDHVPVAGENVRGSDLRTIPGGKGANQAVAAARLGAATAFLGRVGDDVFGPQLLEGLRAEGIGVEAVRTVPGAASGVALIMIDAHGENSIVVTPGANARLSPDDVAAARGLFDEADAVLVQLEIPARTVARTIELGREAGCRVIVDAGPPRRPRDESLFHCHVLTPNVAEAAALLDIESDPPPPVEDLAARLLERGPEAVVIKAGPRGAYVASSGRTEWVEGFSVDAVDTTAAGDAFTSALAIELAEGADLADAVRFANAAGALACTALGAQPSMPARGRVDEFLAERA